MSLDFGRLTASARSLFRGDLLGKALRDPKRVPPAVLGLLFPNSRWGPNWRRNGEYVLFEDGGFAGGDPSRTELSVRIYREVELLRELLGEERFDRSLEVGCGYGRLSGWISNHADASVAIDPDREAVEVARRMYPELEFVATGANTLPFRDDSFDLVVSWAVLQHVSPNAIERAADEVRRVLADGGTLVLCERTRGESGRVSWVRSVREYESLFAPFALQSRTARPAESTFDYADSSETMVFGTDEASAPSTTPERGRSAD